MKLSIKGFSFTLGALWGVLAILFTGLANMIWPGYGREFLELMASVNTSPVNSIPKTSIASFIPTRSVLRARGGAITPGPHCQSLNELSKSKYWKH